MKKKLVVFLLVFSLMGQTMHGSASENIKESESETEVTAVPLTSGSFYNAIMDINAAMEVSVYDDSRLTIMLDTDSSVAKEDIRDFIWDAVQILKLPEMGATYTGASFTLLGDGCFEYFSVSSFVSLYSFSSVYLTSFSTDEVPSSYFPMYYKAIFGAHDSNIVYEKKMYDLAQEYGLSGYEIPDDYRNGALWIYSNFSDLGHSCGYSVNDSTLQVTLVRDNTESAGVNARKEVSSAVKSYDNFCNSDSDSMPYVKLQFVYKSSTDATLWNYTIEKLNGSWSVTTNEGSGDFLTGLNK